MKRNGKKMSRTSNIESDNSQNGGLEDYNYISDGIFPHFTTPSIKNKLRVQIFSNYSNSNVFLDQSELSSFPIIFSSVCFTFSWDPFWIHFGCTLKVTFYRIQFDPF